MSAAAASAEAPSALVERIRRWPALSVLVGWTVLLWTSRLRNVLSNEELDGFDTAWRVGVVVVFVALAIAAATGRSVNVLVWWTFGYWLVRGGGILLDDHDAAFKAVHTVLMVISIGLAMWVWRTRTR